MKFRIAAKLALLLALVGVLAAGATGFYVYSTSRTLVVEAAQKELLTSTQVLGRRVSTAREAISRDLWVLTQHPAARAMLERPNDAQAQQLATLFHLLMQANPGYFQIRLIAAANHGLEVVRVDRDGIDPITVPEEDLQEKGHYAYVSDTLKLAPGSTYLSRFMINHERGTYSVQDKPSAQLAMPVMGTHPKPIGLIVINIDVNRTFTQLAENLPTGFELYLANQQGDILIHPDASKTFGFDKGRRVLLQNEFPATSALFQASATQVVLETPGSGQHPPMVAAFMHFPVEVASAESALILGLAQPLANQEQEVTRLRHNILRIMAGISAVSLLLAVLLARVLTRPLAQLIIAARRFAHTQNAGPLPLKRQDEIGDLARTFGQMAEQIHDQMHTLQENQEEFEFLAHHDTLTNLPNRRMLQDRLTHAIAHAQRHQESVTLLFVDVDQFKQINDTLGHDIGDMVLSTVAQRLRHTVRNADTVARLGGDEFVVLLDGALQTGDIERIVTHLSQAVKSTIEVGDHRLHVSISIGISRYPHNGSTADELLASADQAMYRVKSSGRDGFSFATPR